MIKNDQHERKTKMVIAKYEAVVIDENGDLIRLILPGTSTEQVREIIEEMDPSKKVYNVALIGSL